MKTFKKGFTLIELLVVIAIIGLLSTIIAAPVQQARKKAKDTKKVAEMKAVQTALEVYYDSNQQYPQYLAQLKPAFMQALPSFAASTIGSRDRFSYVAVNGTALNDITAKNLSYHMGVHLDTLHTALDADADCNAFTWSSDTPSAGSASLDAACDAANLTAAPVYWVDPMTGAAPASSVAADPIVGTNAAGNTTDDKTSATCSALTDCVFDLTSQN